MARLGTAAIAEAIVARDAAHGAAADVHGPRVERLRARTVREPPPLLFDLTSLQRTANRRFGWSAARTLELAQALYERHKILTYPRTDSRHLTTDVVRELPALFATLAELPDLAPFAAELVAHPPRPSRRVVDDARVHDHHAIIPTGKPVRSGALDRDEGRLFDLVARRFLGAFYPDAEFALTEAWIRVGAAVEGDPAPAFAPAAPAAPGDPRPGSAPSTDAEPPMLDRLPPPPDRYFARGRVRLAAGWQAVAGIDGAATARDRDRDREDPDAEPGHVLPPLVEGQPLDGTFTPVAKHTTPPARYTEATLLGAMESAGKAIDDEALRAAMKDCGLGTPATRAAIIETLLKRDYIVRTKQQLVPTALGVALIEALPVASLASPELTGTWEARLARIARGEDARAAFMADITRYVTEMVDAIRGSSPPAALAGPGSPAAAPIGRCPRCGAGVVDRPREFTCSAACGFAMQHRVAGRAISAALAGVLLERRRSQPLRGFRSRAGKPFAATLVLDDSGELRFDFGGADRPRAPGSAEPAASHAPEPRARQRTRTRTPSAPAGGGAGHAPRAQRRPAPTRGGQYPPDPQRRPAPPRGGEHPADRQRRPSPTRSAERLPRPAQRPVAIAELGCPRCRQGTLLTGARGWGCSRWRDGCRFVVWFETAGRRLTAAQLRDLVVRGKTRKARFVTDRGVELDGRLVLDPAIDGGSVRLEPA